MVFQLPNSLLLTETLALLLTLFVVAAGFRERGLIMVDAQEASAQKETYWSYSDTVDAGPSRWGELEDVDRTYLMAYPHCSAIDQSPVELSATVVDSDFSLNPMTFLWPRLENVTAVSDGRLLRAYSPASRLFTDPNPPNQRFDLEYLEFHTAGEHLVGGAAADAELYIVFKAVSAPSADSTAPARSFLVVVVRLNTGAGYGENSYLSVFLGVVAKHSDELKALAAEKARYNTDKKNVSISTTVTLDLSHVVGPGGEYFTYDGTLTSPPCSKGAVFYVMRETVGISLEQVEVLRAAVGLPSIASVLSSTVDSAHVTDVVHNRRPTQALGSRRVRQFLPLASNSQGFPTFEPLMAEGSVRGRAAVASLVLSVIALLCCIAALAFRLEPELRGNRGPRVILHKGNPLSPDRYESGGKSASSGSRNAAANKYVEE